MPQSREEKNRKRREQYARNKEASIRALAGYIAEQMENPKGVFFGITSIQFDDKEPMNLEDFKKLGESE